MTYFLTSLKWEYLKNFQSIKTFLIRNMTYKMNFFLLMVIPIFVFFFIKYNLWISIYKINSVEVIQGYTLARMLQYQFGIVLLDLFVRSHFFSQNLSADIRLGKISSFLLYPFNFINYQLSKFISDKILQLFIGLITLFVVLFFDLIEINISILIKFFLFIITINIFWFLTQTFIGLLSFWLEETWSLNICIRFITAFLSGSFIPLDLYPEFLRNILTWTPFPYLIYFPVKVLMGDSVPVIFCLSVISFWILILVFITQGVWKKGLKLYTGTGM